MESSKEINSFVIMPFSEVNYINSEGKEIRIDSEEWKHIFENWIKKAVESYTEAKINCKRSETNQGNFVKGIIQDIYESELAIVDLTGQKPNVYYELGIRHSLKLGTIIITQDFKALPSDLSSYYCVSYEYSEKGHLYNKLYKKFEEELHKQISSVLANPDRSDNPVSDFLDIHYYYQSKEKDRQTKILFNINQSIEKHLLFVLSKFIAELKNKDKSLEGPSIFFTFIDFYDFDSSTSRLFNLEFEYIDQEIVDEMRNLYLNFRRELYHIHQYWEGTVSNLGRSNIVKLFELMESFQNRIPIFLQIFKSISQKLLNER